MPKQQESYIRMVEAERTGRKTKVWEVRTNDGEDTLLGEVRWFGRWRGYAFFPESLTIYEQRCLRAIADFVETKSQSHRKGWSKKQPKSALDRVLGDAGP